MPLSRKPLPEITEADLQALLDQKVPESRTLDYKRDAVGRSDGDKKEFLADVSSFANAAGGHLVFGMDEAGGVPTALPGLAVLDLDAEIRRLDEMIRDGLDPTLLGVELRAVPLAGGAAALVIRIPKSWNPPHQVTYQKTFRFYGRGAAGKHPLDVTALREMFIAQAERPVSDAGPPPFQPTQTTHCPSTFLQPDETVVVVDLAYGRLGTDERASVLADGPQIFLRLMPTVAVPPLSGPDCFKALRAAEGGFSLPLNNRYRDGYWDGRNVHGAVSIVREYWLDGPAALRTISLTQILKTGEIWGIDTALLRYDERERARFGDMPGYFRTQVVQDLFVSGMKRYLRLAETALKLPLPLRVIAGATGVAGFRAAIPDHGVGGRCVEANIVWEGQVDRYDQPAEEILQPFFKHLWAECGIAAPA